MSQTLRVVTINRNEEHSVYKDKILRWCSSRDIDIFYIGKIIGIFGPKRYMWGIACSKEQMLLFMIAWEANVEGKINMIGHKEK